MSVASAADTFQVRSISARRFVGRVGRLTAADIARVSDGLRTVFDL
jgi:mRNA-degrading endonuclease toxin of MazEF toxin-antitoxin module